MTHIVKGGWSVGNQSHWISLGKDCGLGLTTSHHLCTQPQPNVVYQENINVGRKREDDMRHKPHPLDSNHNRWDYIMHFLDPQATTKICFCFVCLMFMITLYLIWVLLWGGLWLIFIIPCLLLWCFNSENKYTDNESADIISFIWLLMKV